MSRSITERFTADVADHQVTVVLDEGLHRHLICQKPGTMCYGFHIVTWPGYLAIAGDCEDFMFSRIEDMFNFFTAPDGGINPHYWAQKLQGPGRSNVATVYTVEAFRTAVLSWASEQLALWDEEATWEEDEHHAVYPSLLIEALEREVLRASPYDEREARELLQDFDWLFGETWEWDLKEYDVWFLWACHAIVWAIERYWQYKAVEGEVYA